MTEQQANDLAARIKADFPHVFTMALPSTDTRNAPRHWFIGVRRHESDVKVLIVRSELDWQDALDALYILSA